MHQEIWVVEDDISGELHFFFCEYDAEDYWRRHKKTKKPIKIKL
jgi:hypothetical protein